MFRQRLIRRLAAPSIALMALLATSTNCIAQSAPRDRASRPATVEGFELAFVDADAKRVVDAVLGAMLGVDYSVDPAVQGTITLRTAQPVPREQLLPLLEAALRSVGAVVIVQGNHYHVLPREAARTQAPVAGGSGGTSDTGQSDIGEVTPGFATEVITLRSGNAHQISTLLKQLVGENVVAGIEPALNQVIITGSAEERRAARQIVSRFDVDAMADMQFELVRLENVDADTLTAELREIFQPPYDIIGSRLRVIALPRLRSLLLIAADRADIVRIQPWIQRLDSGAAGKQRLYSYAVQNGRARDVALILQRVLGMSSSEPAANETAQPIVPAPDGDANGEADSGVPGPERSVAARLGVRSTNAAQHSPRIIASDETNSLIIYADGEEYEFIRDALSRLDQPVPQVLIEAILAEVTLTRDLQYGVNFRSLNGDFTTTNSSIGSGTPASAFPGFSVNWVGASASAVLNSLQSRTNVRVLSAPKLVVLNNQTATLQVGDQVPVVTQQQQGVSSPGAPVINTIDLRDTGVILRVTPRVNDSGTVTLDISQEVSDVARTTTSGINSPTIQQRRLTSVVATRSGQMVALGGLIRDSTTQGRSGIPLLSQIPVLGGLFGNHTTNNSRTELIILLTPTVIRAPEDVGAIVAQLIDALDVAGPLVEQGIAGQVGTHPLPIPAPPPR